MGYQIDGSYVGKKIHRPKKSVIKRKFRKHAAKRVEERFGESLKECDKQSILKAIKRGNCITAPNDRTTEIKILTFKGRTMAFVYNPKYHRIETVLPKEWGQNKYGPELTTEEKYQKIRDGAYLMWVNGGYPHGRDVEHWLICERRINEKNR